MRSYVQFNIYRALCFYALIENVSSFFVERASCRSAILKCRKPNFSMEYSATELSNLKSITAKKLGQKLSDDYLLISSTVKSSQSRSEILDCIAQSDLQATVLQKLKAKIVKEQDRYEREFKNYQVYPNIHNLPK